ncbi:DUF11 domain-containing protein [Nonomuraea sp. NPDC052129]|uniref:DUF11 domain-containing protein n=1 Tax=Nonomuraea sp. NPDC052129 TaxID=3154651 RepID=UPI00342DC1A9
MQIKPAIRYAVALVVALAGVFVTSPPATAETAFQPLTLRVLLVNCVAPCRNEGLEAADESAPDFYAEITFDGFDTYTTPRAPDDQVQVAPNWSLTKQIPTTKTEQKISVLIKDHDDTSPDDWGDASPRHDDPYARFTVNLIHGTVTGDLTSSTGCVAGNGEPGGGIFGPDPKPSVQVCVDITPYPSADTDGDGFTDYEEYRGRDFNNDNVVDLTLPGADAERRDVYVEVDWMQGQAPQTGVLQDVEGVFNNALVINDQHRTGIGLHLLADEAVPHVASLEFNNHLTGTLDDFDDLKLGNPERACGPTATGHFGTAQDRSSPLCDDILLFKRLHFRYGMFIDSLPTFASGMAELDERGSNDFVVAVNGLGNSLINTLGGRKVAEESTFLHELGHTLGLGHGGRFDNGDLDPHNCKPNYLSVMNYLYQFPDVDTTRPLDLATVATDTLTENGGLDEIRSPALARAGSRLIVHGVGGKSANHPANKAIHWAGEDGSYSDHATEDVNFIPAYGPECATASPGDTLLSHTDWDRLQFNFTSSRYFSEGAHGQAIDELTKADLERVHSIDLAVTKTVDKSDAQAGDTLTYTVRGTNKSANEASSVTLTDTPPSGEPITRSVGALPATETFTYQVPCTAVDGSTLTNTVKISGRNAAGEPEVESTLADNTATASTTAHAPVLTLSQTATPSAEPGEAITYTLAYRNTGSAQATGATLTQTLPAGLYYSQALDKGSGPRPGTVTRNADGTTTLAWTVGALAPDATGSVTITARPSLLTPPEPLTVQAALRYGGQNGCAFTPATAQATTQVTQPAPTKNPQLTTVWALRGDLRTPEVLARVQATDTRFDGADGSTPDGALSQAEATAVLTLPVLQPRTLRAELLATALNLATHRINAGTAIRTITIERLGLHTVADAYRFTAATLALPVLPNAIRYTDNTLALTEINSNLAERY